MNIRAAVAPAAGVLALQRLRDRMSGRADTRLALGGAFLAFGIRIAGAALAFVSHALIARWMGADGFGIYAYAWCSSSSWAPSPRLGSASPLCGSSANTGPAPGSGDWLALFDSPRRSC